MGAGSNQNSRVLRQGSWEDFDAAAALSGNATMLRSRWEVPSFDPSRHLWLADGAFGALYAPDEAVVRGNPAHVPALLERIEERAREEGISQLTFVIPETDEPAWRAYEQAGFALLTVVLEMAVDFEAPPPEPQSVPGVTVRTYTDADAHAVRGLLDDAYTSWDESYVPFTHEDWLAFMTDHEGFDPDYWFLAEAEGDARRRVPHVEGGLDQGSRRRARRAQPRPRRDAPAARVRASLRARRAEGRAQGRRAQSDERDPTLRATRDARREASSRLPEEAVTASRSNAVGLLRWLRRQLAQPTPLRERLEAAVANDDPAEARRCLAQFEFSESQRRHVEALLDAWEQERAGA